MPGKAKPKAKRAAPAGEPRTKAAKRPAKVGAKRASASVRARPATKGATGQAKAAGAAEGWQAATLAEARRLIREADPDAVEEVKWRKPSNAMQGVPTWSHDGLLCTGETYKDKVKLTFAKGASLPDPHGLFNADDRGATRRAIDLREGDRLDPAAFKQLVQAAVARNLEA